MGLLSRVCTLRKQSQLLHAVNGQGHWEGAFDVHASELGKFTVFDERPDFLKDLVELFLVRQIKDLLGGYLPVMELDPAICKTGHHWVMSNHDYGLTLAVQF